MPSLRVTEQEFDEMFAIFSDALARMAARNAPDARRGHAQTWSLAGMSTKLNKPWTSAS
jgi:hypothetical protein